MKEQGSDLPQTIEQCHAEIIWKFNDQVGTIEKVMEGTAVKKKEPEVEADPNKYLLRIEAVKRADLGDHKLARVHFALGKPYEEMRFAVLVPFLEWDLKTIVDDAVKELSERVDRMQNLLLEMMKK